MTEQSVLPRLRRGIQALSRNVKQAISKATKYHLQNTLQKMKEMKQSYIFHLRTIYFEHCAVKLYPTHSQKNLSTKKDTETQSKMSKVETDEELRLTRR